MVCFKKWKPKPQAIVYNVTSWDKLVQKKTKFYRNFLTPFEKESNKTKIDKGQRIKFSDIYGLNRVSSISLNNGLSETEWNGQFVICFSRFFGSGNMFNFGDFILNYDGKSIFRSKKEDFRYDKTRTWSNYQKTDFTNQSNFIQNDDILKLSESFRENQIYKIQNVNEVNTFNEQKSCKTINFRDKSMLLIQLKKEMSFDELELDPGWIYYQNGRKLEIKSQGSIGSILLRS
jgi:hypothetical protein